METPNKPPLARFCSSGLDCETPFACLINSKILNSKLAEPPVMRLDVFSFLIFTQCFMPSGFHPPHLACPISGRAQGTFNWLSYFRCAHHMILWITCSFGAVPVLANDDSLPRILLLQLVHVLPPEVAILVHQEGEGFGSCGHVQLPICHHPCKTLVVALVRAKVVGISRSPG